MGALLLMLLAADPDAATLLARGRRVLAAEPACARDRNATDITVCGLRAADRFRVPFIGYEAGDPRGESVMTERKRLLHKTTPCQDRGPFLIGCGMVGVGVSTSASGTHASGLRKPAP